MSNKVETTYYGDHRHIYIICVLSLQMTTTRHFQTGLILRQDSTSTGLLFVRLIFFF